MQQQASMWRHTLAMQDASWASSTAQTKCPAPTPDSKLERKVVDLLSSFKVARYKAPCHLKPLYVPHLKPLYVPQPVTEWSSRI